MAEAEIEADAPPSRAKKVTTKKSAAKRTPTKKAGAKKVAASKAATKKAAGQAPPVTSGPSEQQIRSRAAAARPEAEPERLVGPEPEPNVDVEAEWERRLAELFAFLRRRITGEYDVDEYGFDIEVFEKLVLAAVRPLANQWFRVEVRGIENIPAEGGALIVSNHSGTLPLDGVITSLVVHDHAGRVLRSLGADLVYTLPFIGELARKGGATLACNEDAERLLSGGELVGVWPEGFKGLGKPFSERYKLQRFGRGGFVTAALRTRVPIIPCSVVGAEEIYPMLANASTLARVIGVPYLPVTPLFPWLGIAGLVPLPSKWLIEFGEPIRTDELGDSAAEDPMLVFNVTDQVRETIQQTLYSLLTRRRGVFG